MDDESGESGDLLSPKRSWSMSRDSFLHFWAPVISLELTKLDTSNYFDTQIDRNEYYHMHVKMQQYLFMVT